MSTKKSSGRKNRNTRSLRNGSPEGTSNSEGLKPASLLSSDGTAESPALPKRSLPDPVSNPPGLPASGFRLRDLGFDLPGRRSRSREPKARSRKPLRSPTGCTLRLFTCCVVCANKTSPLVKVRLVCRRYRCWSLAGRRHSANWPRRSKSSRRL